MSEPSASDLLEPPDASSSAGFPGARCLRGRRVGRRRGISLVEVLVALAVFALAFVGIARVLSGLVDAAVRMERTRYLQNEMESRLVQLRKGFLQPMKEEEKADARGIRYILEIRRMDARNDQGQPLSGFYTLRVEAHWGEGIQAGSDALEVIAYQP